MSAIVRAARALMAVMQPRTGTRATGTVIVKAIGSDVTIPRNSYACPVVEGRIRPDLAMKTAEGPETNGAWTATSSGTAIDFFSNIGGRRHNIASGTTLRFDPEISGIESLESSGAFSGGADLAEFGALRDIVLYEQFDGPILSLDMFRSLIKGFPAAIIAWEGSEPADGAISPQKERDTRAGSKASIYTETFQIAVISERNEGDDIRRSEGLLAAERICTAIAERHYVDGEPFSNPSGVQIRRRWRERGRQPVYQRFYVYAIQVGVMGTIRMDEYRTFGPWETSKIDVQKPTTPPKEVVDEALVDMTP